ncbi:hypothetical protein CR516_12270, partial [Enterococcus faecium]
MNDEYKNDEDKMLFEEIENRCRLNFELRGKMSLICLPYTSDAPHQPPTVAFGGRFNIIKITYSHHTLPTTPAYTFFTAAATFSLTATPTCLLAASLPVDTHIGSRV